jgi:hypothetical protein
MARRAGLWALSGATAATGMLIASPDAYAWLRRKAGLDQGATPSDAVPADDDAAESTFDTREARLSLRARLSEAEADTQITPPAAAKRKAAAPATTDERPLAARPRPKREEVEPMRRAVDDARERMLASARKATKENGPAA